MCLKPLPRTLSGILRQPGCGKFVSAYAHDTTVIVTEMDNLSTVSKVIKDYKMVAEAKINREKSAGLGLGA